MLAQVGSEMYTPSIPSIAKALNTSVNMVKLSLAIYMVGICLTQLIYGPISDLVGRRFPIIFGVSVFIVGTFICGTALDVNILLLGRFIQGIGAGGPAALWRAIFRDKFHGPKLAKYSSYLTVAIALIFPVTPALGGYLEVNFGWRSNFSFMGFYSVFVLGLLIFCFRESHISLNKDKITLKSVLRIYGTLFKTPIFIGSTGFVFIIFGCLFSATATLPILFIQLLNTSPTEFGVTICLTATTGMIVASWINSRLVERWGIPLMLKIGTTTILVSGLTLGGTYLLIGVHKGCTIASMLILYFSAGFLFPNAFALAFSGIKQNIGYAGALYGFIQMGGGAFWGTITSFVPDDSPLPLAFIFLICSLLGYILHGGVMKDFPAARVDEVSDAINTG